MLQPVLTTRSGQRGSWQSYKSLRFHSPLVPLYAVCDGRCGKIGKLYRYYRQRLCTSCYAAEEMEYVRGLQK